MTETGKQIAPMETFMERVKAKLRDDIGSLLPDEAVQAMVEKVINDEFFTKKRVPAPGRSSWSNETIEQPTEFQQMVIAAAKPILERKALELIAARAPELEKAITDAMNGGLMKFAVQAFDQLFAQALSGHAWHIENVVRQAMEAKRI